MYSITECIVCISYGNTTSLKNVQLKNTQMILKVLLSSYLASYRYSTYSFVLFGYRMVDG